MKIVIVGQGAIGLLWYSRLSQQSGNQVKLACSARAKKLPEHVLCTDLAHTERKIKLNHAGASDFSQADFVLFCLKAYDFRQAFEQYCPDIDEQTPIVLCHNGILDSNFLPKSHTLLTLLTTHGSKKISPFVIEHTGEGQSDLGLIQGQLSTKQKNAIYQVLNSALPTTYWQESINDKQWQKLLINCVINPLTAIHDCDNGEITKRQYQEDIQQILNEILPLAKHSGVTLNYEEMKTLVLTVAKNTAKNTSSMRSDVLNGRKTEIDHINGFIERLGACLKLETPKNSELYQRVRLLERHN